MVRVRVSPLGEEGGAPHVDVEAATSPEALAWLGLGLGEGEGEGEGESEV